MNPLLRRALHGWFLVRRATTLGVRAVVLDDDSRVLLVRHTYVDGWHLPGGGVEIGETARTALFRELDEEAGIAVVGEPDLRGISFNGHVSRRDHVMVYAVRNFRRIRPVTPNSEIAAAGFFPVDALPDGVADGTRERIREVLEGLQLPEHWA